MLLAALTTEVSELKNLMKTMLIDKQKAQAPASVKAVEQSCVTCGGAHSYKNCPATDGNETSALADFGASINILPHSIYKQLGLGALTPTRMTLELANRSVTHPMDPRVPIILERPFLRTAKALIDLYEEKLTLRVGSDELVFYAEKSEKSKNKQFAHAISVIDFSKDEPFSGSTINHSDALPPSSSPVKTSDNLEEFADELTLLKEVVHEENFQVYSNPLFEFDDNFTSSNVILSLTRLMKMSKLRTPTSDPLHHEFAGELMTLPSRIVREHEDYLNRMTLLCEIEASRSLGNFHASPSAIIESLPIPVKDSEPVQEEIDIFLVPDDLIPPGVENDDSENKDNSILLTSFEIKLMRIH
ncbi:hypothetical protein Tco_0458974 [Tanacetum coccineum]